MTFRSALLGLAVFLAAEKATALTSKCPTQCPLCPEPTPCPEPRCPLPTCPPLPVPPPCPVPRCPPIPPIPPCPPPLVNVSCPEVSCPDTPCPSCPPCPEPPPCPPCPTLPTPRVLPNGYRQETGLGVYKVYRGKASWPAANQTCAEDGGYLAVPDSEAEKQLFIEWLENYNLRYGFHIGFVRKMFGKPFTTVLGDALTSAQILMWKNGRATGTIGGDCTYLSRTHTAVVAEQCLDTEPFVCELPRG